MGKIGFIGLGQIGAPMAEHLLDWPGGLVVCDIRAEACEPFAGRGAEVAASAAAVAEAGATVISLMVLDDAQVRSVVGEILPVAEPGTVIAIHSTIRPETAEALAAEAAELGRDICVVDAPVSGGAIGAAQGNLAVMIGGDRAAYEKCKEAFAGFAGLVLHFGPVGSGTRAKLARNLLSFVGFAAAAESQRLAEAAGVDLRKLGSVVRHSDALTGGPGAVILRSETGPLPVDDFLYGPMLHTRTLGEKDLSLALELAAQNGIDLPFAALALQSLAAGLGVPHTDDDDVAHP